MKNNHGSQATLKITKISALLISGVEMTKPKLAIFKVHEDFMKNSFLRFP